MVIDFIVSVTAISALTWVAYWLGVHFLIRRPTLDTRVFLGVVTLALVFSWSYFGRLVWAERLPVASALYWSNWTPLLLGFAAGLAGHAAGLRVWVRPIASAVLLVLAVGYLVTPLARPVLFPLDIASENLWRDGICLQSHSASCAPAAAVTLFAQHGIATREQDLADMCLTSSLGTDALGLYRGLSSFAKLHRSRAVVADRDPARWLNKQQLPNVSLVFFERVTGEPKRVADYFGSPGEGHAVTVLGRTDGGRWLIGDPAVGRLTWSDAEFRHRFTGEAIYLQASR